ncbi:hypothetical protein HETIRDRAFT_115472 [Heterobasidion irregulare TC 32-1]|uniref:Uncharacterized protein n=1 Tax=Heterobasidion irregulare (strain TC 32-1) TaxID=747525 RepID=W4KGU0_HETIT|nr:uncharacterized protein HETIRDRAFT_115472 [Heterobasidion irregulare TC 32-1]ETW85062.1 hypothetical protein HETIRDRAFT_115472 [Heterobasidion irregulare TC 32-1]
MKDLNIYSHAKSGYWKTLCGLAIASSVSNLYVLVVTVYAITCEQKIGLLFATFIYPKKYMAHQIIFVVATLLGLIPVIVFSTGLSRLGLVLSGPDATDVSVSAAILMALATGCSATLPWVSLQGWLYAFTEWRDQSRTRATTMNRNIALDFPRVLTTIERRRDRGMERTNKWARVPAVLLSLPRQDCSAVNILSKQFLEMIYSKANIDLSKNVQSSSDTLAWRNVEDRARLELKRPGTLRRDRASAIGFNRSPYHDQEPGLQESDLPTSLLSRLYNGIRHGSKIKVEEVQLLYGRIRFREIGRADSYFELAYNIKPACFGFSGHGCMDLVTERRDGESPDDVGPAVRARFQGTNRAGGRFAFGLALGGPRQPLSFVAETRVRQCIWRRKKPSMGW